MNRTVYITPVDGKLLALDSERGNEIASLEFHGAAKDSAPELQKILCRVMPTDTRMFYVADPAAHPRVAEILRKREAEEVAAEEEPEPTFGAGELRVFHERAHLCRECVHTPVCRLAHAAREMEEQTLAVITACLMYSRTKEQEP